MGGCGSVAASPQDSDAAHARIWRSRSLAAGLDLLDPRMINTPASSGVQFDSGSLSAEQGCEGQSGSPVARQASELLENRGCWPHVPERTRPNRSCGVLTPTPLPIFRRTAGRRSSPRHPSVGGVPPRHGRRRLPRRNSNRGGRIRTGDLLLPNPPRGTRNHGKKSRKFIQDCTICASCCWGVSGSAGLKKPENRVKWRAFGCWDRRRHVLRVALAPSTSVVLVPTIHASRVDGLEAR